MNSLEPTASSPRDQLDVHAQLDVFCERLRKSIEQNGHGPIEELLQEAPEALRERLFPELVAEDAQMRLRRGEQPTLEEYLNRFPDRREMLERALESALGQASFSTTKANHDTVNPDPTNAAAARGTDEFYQFGQYRVLQVLGAGTFGKVFKCRHASSGLIVAVKMLKPEWANDPQCGQAMRKQFTEEARAMLEFDHPNVVRIISLDERSDPPYFVQEFINGQTLRGRMRPKRLGLNESLECLVQMTDALAHIHSREKWHRDLKPENILLDGANRVHLADFGLVLDDARRWQSSRSPVGTFQYMAPEQVQGATHLLNARCDLWAVGVIAYELFTGTRPFHGTTVEQLRNEILERTPTAPRDLNPQIPRRLNRLCMQCLAKRDSDRPDSAADVREDFSEQLQVLRDGKDASGSANSPSRIDWSAVDSSPPSVQPSNDTTNHTVEYPIPTLRRFTTEQAELYLRLMPKSYTNAEELPELIAYWKQRILLDDSDRAFRIGIMVGVSGCGKSSLLEAGLVPQLPPHIKPILIEASENDTEVRILNKLRRIFPQADPDQSWSLPTWTFRLRSSDLLPKGHKVVFVLDQFEQWLNVHGGEPSNQLLDALHQCDGEHLQTIVCVREGFHATLMRFVQSLRLVLDEDSNYATAHRFSRDHAVFVLEQFGRGLKRLDDPITAAQREFLDATVLGLSESDRGVVCVRLVVLASVMSDRSWTVQELEKLGGLDGIGCQFLIDCFEGRTASEQYRRYLPAAMRVLARLLPAKGLEIKDIRGYDELLRASELDSAQFEDLLSILTRKLFLITLVEQDVGSVMHSGSVHATGRHYQLTHDFLIPALREWLARKLRETREGRAQLLLQDRTAVWSVKPENRNLPTLTEWLLINWFTDRKKWTSNQKTVMQRAGRMHATRGGLVGSAAILLIIASALIRNQVLHNQEATRVQGMVAQLTSAEPAHIPEIVRQLDASADLAFVYLKPLVSGEAKTIDEKRAKFHARLATVARDRAQVDPLLGELFTNKVSYIGPIRQLLRPYAGELTEKLRAILQDEQAEANHRFRAACALADYIPTSDANSWTEADIQFVAQQLVLANAEFQPLLRDYLRPISGLLLADLEKIFGDTMATGAQRLSAANAFADYAVRDIPKLSQLLAFATPDQFKVLYTLVAASKVPATAEDLGRIAAALPPDDLGSVERIPYGQRRANAAVSLLRLGEREKVLPVYDMTDDPEALTQFVFHCRDRGVRASELVELLQIVTRSVSERPSNRLSPPASEASLAHASGDNQSRARYALLLALGEYPLNEIPDSDRDVLLKQLSDWYRHDPSSGVHGAAGWLLRQWGQHEVVKEIDQTAVPYSPESEWFTLAIETKEKSSSNVGNLLGSSNAKKFYYTFIVFSPGDYRIGSHLDEPWQQKNEARHMVKLTRPFALLDREITMEELIAFDENYSRHMQIHDAKPSDSGFTAHWYDSVGFCRWLSTQLGLDESDQSYANPETLDTKKFPREQNAVANWAPRDWPLKLDRRGFRLPTESEWEVAARAQSRTTYGFGSDVALLKHFGWFMDNSGKHVHAPKKLRPSMRGLFDLHGNLLEKTHDWYRNYETESVTDPLGALSGSHRVDRGGGWQTDAAENRSAYRNSSTPTYRAKVIGFRLALSPSAKSPEAGDNRTEQAQRE